MDENDESLVMADFFEFVLFALGLFAYRLFTMWVRWKSRTRANRNKS
jgi:hypothetical protein